MSVVVFMYSALIDTCDEVKCLQVHTYIHTCTMYVLALHVVQHVMGGKTGLKHVQYASKILSELARRVQ